MDIRSPVGPGGDDRARASASDVMTGDDEGSASNLSSGSASTDPPAPSKCVPPQHRCTRARTDTSPLGARARPPRAPQPARPCVPAPAAAC